MTEQSYAPVRDSTTLIEPAVKKPPPNTTEAYRRLHPLLSQLAAEFSSQPKPRGRIKELAQKYGIRNTIVRRFLRKHCPRPDAGTLPGEVWDDVSGFEGLYRVSTLGRVKRSRLLKPRLSYDGYEIVALAKHGKTVQARVHRLVAIAFILNPDNLPEVNHKDGNKRNNQKDNLEWSSSYDNKIHAHRLGLYPSSARKSLSSSSQISSNGNQQ